MTYCTNCHMGVAKYPGGLCFYCHGLPAGILARDYPQYYPLRKVKCEIGVWPEVIVSKEEAKQRWPQAPEAEPTPEQRLLENIALRSITTPDEWIPGKGPFLHHCSECGADVPPEFRDHHGNDGKCSLGMARRAAKPERRTCTLCKQPVVDGYCRCIIG